MSRQLTLDQFFSVRKPSSQDQHAAKRRKVLLDDASSSSNQQDAAVLSTEADSLPQIELEAPSLEEVSTSVVSSVTDDHILGIIKPVVTTPKKSTTDEVPTQGMNRKRDSHGNLIGLGEEDRTDLKVLFSHGKVEDTMSKARKKLVLGDRIEEKIEVSFHRLSQCSPIKDCPPPTKEVIVPFEKRGPLSPVKKPVVDISQIKAQGVRILSGLEKAKLSPQEIKSKLGTVSKLSELQSKLKALSSKPLPTLSSPAHRRALFNDPISTSPKNPILLEIVKERPQHHVAVSPIKASPRKAIIETPIVASNLTVPDKRLPLPWKYRFIAEMFQTLDQIISMKHNRNEKIRIADVQPAVQLVLRRKFSEDHLKQIRCVFPAAYHFYWERLRDRLGRETSNFDLRMEVNLDYKDGASNKQIDRLCQKLNREKFTPAAQVERLKILKHNLLSIAQDHHREFLKELGIDLSDDVTAWHKDFDIESLPDVDTVDFPPRPDIQKACSAQEVIERIGSGMNSRLESALNQHASVVALSSSSSSGPSADLKDVETKDSKTEVKILKDLQGLSPDLLEMLKAKEKSRQLKSLLITPNELKEIELLEELVEIAPLIVNCHRSQRNGAAVPSETLFEMAAASHGRKTKKEMEELTRLFIKLVPECLEARSYEKVEYIKQRKPIPDINMVRQKLKKLVNDKKNAL